MILVFDAYGTLWDVSQIQNACEAVVGPDQAPALLALWRHKQLEYAFLRTVMNQYTPFMAVTADALTFSLEHIGCTVTASDRRRLLQAWMEPQAFAEALPALSALAGHTRLILSNGDPDMLQAGVARTGLKPCLEDTLSVAPARRFKPHPAAYQLACDHCQATADHVYFISSNGWDIAGSGHFGFHPIWIQRSPGPCEALGVQPHAIIPHLADLPALVASFGSPSSG